MTKLRRYIDIHHHEVFIHPDNIVAASIHNGMAGPDGNPVPWSAVILTKMATSSMSGSIVIADETYPSLINRLHGGDDNYEGELWAPHRVAQDMYVMLLSCGHWIQSKTAEGPWRCYHDADHGYQPAGQTEDGTAAVIGMWASPSGGDAVVHTTRVYAITYMAGELEGHVYGIYSDLLTADSELIRLNDAHMQQWNAPHGILQIEEWPLDGGPPVKDRTDVPEGSHDAD